MRYEGYSQLICKKGHYWTKDYYEMDYTKLSDHKCSKCNELAIWENMVNVTNGSFDDDGTRIDGYIKLQIKMETSGVCGACGAKHVCNVTYWIPGENEKSI